eukprot:5607579-Prymnesium_polylepis.1
MSVFNFDLQQARLDCFDGWGGMRAHVVLQLSLPLLAACIYVALVPCAATRAIANCIRCDSIRPRAIAHCTRCRSSRCPLHPLPLEPLPTA